MLSNEYAIEKLTMLMVGVASLLFVCDLKMAGAQIRTAFNLSDSQFVELNEGVHANFSDTPVHRWEMPHDLAAHDTRGYAILLPGILGQQFWDQNIQQGIHSSLFNGQTEIYDWTHGPWLMAANVGGSQKQAKFLAERIAEFNRVYPSRPVYLIGHSGGCRVAIQVLEQLPPQARIERVVLLSPCMEANYDLTLALSSIQNQLVVFYSALDVLIPIPLSFAHGIAKGNFDRTCATKGFKLPSGATEQSRRMYQSRLVQHKFEGAMVRSGNVGGHFGWTMPAFVSRYIAPYLFASFER